MQLITIINPFARQGNNFIYECHLYFNFGVSYVHFLYAALMKINLNGQSKRNIIFILFHTEKYNKIV